MGIFDAIWKAGEDIIGGNDSPIGNMIGSVVQAAGKDGWDGIVNEFTSTESGTWGAIGNVMRSELGEEYGGLVDGIKGAIDGDYNAVTGAVIGGVRDYVGDERFDEIATSVGQVINGNTEDLWSEATGLITGAVGNDTFTAIVDGVNEMGGAEYGQGLLGGALGEIKDAVGEDTWGRFETAAGIHAEIVGQDQDRDKDEGDAKADSAEDATATAAGDVTDENDPAATADESESDDVDFDAEDAIAFAATTKATGADDGAGAGAGEGTFDVDMLRERSIEDYLEGPIQSQGEFLDGEVIQPAPGTGVAMDDMGDMIMGTGFPGGAPINPDLGIDLYAPGTTVFVPIDEPVAADPVAFEAPAEDTVAQLIAEPAVPTTEFQADLATAQTFDSAADSFFKGIGESDPEPEPEPADGGFEADSLV